MTVRTGAATGVAVAAVDLGATSGRVMVAEFGRDVATLREVARFRNDPLELDDGLHWDITALYRGTLGGLRDAVRAQRAREAVPLGSVGVDSWAVDYGLLAQGHLLGLPFHYRDGRTASVIARTRASGLSVARFRRNGLRDLPFNTEFQLAADDLAAVADRFLLIPDLFIYWMTGTDRAERTNASTTGLLNIATREWDPVAFQAANVPLALAAPLIDPGDDLGNITGPAARMTDAKLPCIAVGSHDTASAVVGVPALDDGFAYVSCGTWGLVGLELSAPVVTDAARVAGFTNELGVDGTVRFLRNVTGLWLLSESLRTWETEDGTPPVMADLLTAAAHFPTPAVFDVDDERFSPPGTCPRASPHGVGNTSAPSRPRGSPWCA